MNDKDNKDTMAPTVMSNDSVKHHETKVERSKDMNSHTRKEHRHRHHVYNLHDDFLYLAFLSAPILGPQFIAPIVEAKLLLPTFEIMVAASCVFLAMLLLYVTMWWPKPPDAINAVRASVFTPEKVPTDLDTIVIGSGSGGATCANLLAQSGQRVLVLEQHPTATGGCTHSFREQNCEWDTGLHYTSKGMSSPTERPGAIMNFMSRGAQEWTPLEDPYDEIMFPKKDNDDAGGDGMVSKACPNFHTYPYMSGEKPCIDAIMERADPNPKAQETHKIIRERVRVYMQVCKEINSGFTALGISRILPSWLHFLVRAKIDRLYKYATFTVRDVQYAVLNLGYTCDQIVACACGGKTAAVAASHGKEIPVLVLPKAPDGPDPDVVLRRLKGVLCHPIGDYAVQPREATMAAHGVTMCHYMNGGSYTVGATQRISIRLTSMVRHFGGDVFCDVTVRSIIIDEDTGRAVGVRVCNTSALEAFEQDQSSAKSTPAPVITEIRAKNIVCATSIYNLYHKFLPQEMKVVQQFHDPRQRSVRQSHGHVFLFCKLKGTPEELKLPTHNLWYFHKYDLDSAFDAYFANPTEVRPPTVYIGFPCTKDKTWNRRFPHTSNCLMISDGLYEWFEKWADKPDKPGKPCRHRGKDYEQFKEKLTHHLMDILLECVPQLQDKIEFHHLGTPLTEVTYLGSYRGGSYGTKCTPDMFETKNRQWTTTPHTKVPGLFVAGSDAFLPSVVGAMYGGGLGACAVLGHVGTLRLGMALMSHMSHQIRKEHPKMGVMESYREAVRCFLK